MVEFIEIKKFNTDKIKNTTLIFDDDITSTSKLIKRLLKNDKQSVIITNTSAYFSFVNNIYIRSSYDPKLIYNICNNQVKLYDKKIKKPITIVISIKEINENFELLVPKFINDEMYKKIIHYGNLYNIKLITHIYSLTHIRTEELRIFDTVFMRSYEENNVTFDKKYAFDYELIKSIEEEYKKRTHDILCTFMSNSTTTKDELITMYDKCNNYNKYLVYNYTKLEDYEKIKYNKSKGILSPPLYYN
jgi:hypothetical protein